MRLILFHIVFFLSAITYGQRIHMEIGGTLEFNDVFIDQPELISEAKFTEFHSLGLNGLLRVSKRKFATQLNIGFMKAVDQFVRYIDGSTSTAYVNLNSFPIGVLESFYLIKQPEKKLDVQIGIVNEFYINRSVFVPSSQEVNSWTFAGRGAVNYTYRTFICGVYYDHSFRSQFSSLKPSAIFGASIGLIY